MMRVRKARRSSVCPICRALISAGQQICLPPGLDWSHVACFLGPALTYTLHRNRLAG